MKLSAFVVPSLLVAFASLLFVPGAEAQRPLGDSRGRQIPCLCAAEEGTGTPFCSDDDRPCTSLTPCASSAQCAAGELCVDADNFCGQAVCIVVCDSQTCTDPGSASGGGFPPCPDAAPTMGQWGLITLAVLLLLGGAVLLRLNGRAARAAIVLVALSALTAAWAYGSFRANPKACGPAETAVLAEADR